MQWVISNRCYLCRADEEEEFLVKKGILSHFMNLQQQKSCHHVTNFSHFLN